MINIFPPISKTLVVLMLSFGLFNWAKAQITITSTDMSSVDDTFRLSQAPPPQGQNPFDLSLTGSNYVWNFTNLVSEEQTIDTFFSPLQTPLSYNFVFTNLILYPDNFANLAQRSQTLPQNPGGGGGGGGGFNISDAYDFINKSSSEYGIVGNAFMLNDIPSANAFDNTDVLYEFPLNFQDQYSSPSKYEINIPTFVEYYHSQIRTNEVDGWGKVYTPIGGFDALRVKSTIVSNDSIIFLGGPFPFTFNLPSTTIEYKWLAKNIGVPVLQIDQRTTQGGFGGGGNQTGISKVAYLDSLPVGTFQFDNTSVFENEAPNFSIYPNPANESISLNLFENSNLDQWATIRELSGKAIINQKLSKQFIQIDISGLAKGVYLVEIAGKMSKLVKL